MKEFTKQLIDPTVKTVSSMRWAFVRGNQATWAMIAAFLLIALIMIIGGFIKHSNFSEIGSGLQGLGTAFALVIASFQAFIQGGKTISKFGEVKSDVQNSNITQRIERVEPNITQRVEQIEPVIPTNEGA